MLVAWIVVRSGIRIVYSVLKRSIVDIDFRDSQSRFQEHWLGSFVNLCRMFHDFAAVVAVIPRSLQMFHDLAALH